MAFSDLRRASARLVDARPVWAQLSITARCNVDGAAMEGEPPEGDVPLGDLVTRIERCRALGVLHVDLVGGEPLLHGDLDGLVREIAARRMTSGIVTDGSLLTVARVDRLVDAGLGGLQITADFGRATRGHPRSLQKLKEKIELCAELPISFRVNTVVGDDTLSRLEEIARFCFELGVGLNVALTDERGRLEPAPEGRSLEMVRWLRMEKQLGRSVVTPYYLLDYYERTLAGAAPTWTCQAGQKCFYVGPEGRFHYCAHVPPAGDLASVTARDLRGAGGVKGCERNCGVDCVLQTSLPLSNLGMVIASELVGRTGAALAGARLRLPIVEGAR